MKESRDLDRRPAQNISENLGKKKKSPEHIREPRKKKKKKKKKTQIDHARPDLGRRTPHDLA